MKPTPASFQIRKILLPLLVFLLMFPVAYADDPFDGWQQMRTAHFQLIFEPRDLSYAQTIATFADEAYLQVAQLLDHYPQNLIPVVIGGRSAFANGYFSPLPAKIAIYTTSPADLFLGPRSADWLRSVFVHELTHYIHLTAPVGISRWAVPVFGPLSTLMNRTFMPGWWVEGITTYSETHNAPGGRGDSAFFELTLKAPLLEDAMWSLTQSGYASAFPPSGRIYSSGYYLVDYIMRTYGEQTYTRINTQFARFPFFGINGAIDKITGTSTRQIYQDMQAELKASFNTSAWTDGAQTQLRGFSPKAIGDYYLPHPTAQGWIGWISTQDEYGAIVRYGQPGDQPEILKRVSISDEHAFDVTADGQQCVFTTVWSNTSHPAATATTSVSYSDLFMYDIPTDQLTRITYHQKLAQCAISADGSTIVAIEAVGDRYRLVRINPTDGHTQVLYDNPKGSVYEPRLATDGSCLVVEIVEGQSSLVLIDADGNGQALWPHTPAGIFQPRFAQDGTILFGCDRQGSLAVYRYNPATGVTTGFLEDRIGVFGAEIHQDTVVYATYTSQGYALGCVPLDSIVEQVVSEPFPTGTRLPSRPDEAAAFPVSPYHDLIRLGFWLPLPYMDAGTVNPGAYLLMQSVLGYHTLEVTTGWNIDDAVPVGSLQYQYAIGGVNVLFTGLWNASYRHSSTEWARQHTLSGTLSLPLWRQPMPDQSQRLTAGALTKFNFGSTASDSDTLVDSLWLTYTTYRYAASKAYFGDLQGTLQGGMQNNIYLDGNYPMVWLPFASISGQIPLGNNHQVIRVELDAIARLDGDLSSMILLPRGDPGWAIDDPVQGKLRGTLLYRIPLGLVDQPIPYGGVLGMGLTLFTQTAAYASDGSLTWEKDVYAGLELAMDVKFWASTVIRPMIGLVISLGGKGCSVYFDMGI